MRQILSACALIFSIVTIAHAQNHTCPTAPLGTSNNQCASTEFVQEAISGEVFGPQPAHKFFAGPTSGSPADPTFRSIVNGDLPGGALIGTGQIITGSGTVTVAATDSYIVLNKGSPSSTTINLPTVAARAGLVLEIYDFAGNAGTITVNATGGDLIMGLSSWTVLSGGSAGTGGTLKLTPLATVGWLAR